MFGQYFQRRVAVAGRDGTSTEKRVNRIGVFNDLLRTDKVMLGTSQEEFGVVLMNSNKWLSDTVGVAQRAKFSSILISGEDWDKELQALNDGPYEYFLFHKELAVATKKPKNRTAELERMGTNTYRVRQKEQYYYFNTESFAYRAPSLQYKLSAFSRTQDYSRNEYL